MSLEVTLIPALSDNYIYALTCTETNTLAILDPADEKPVLQYLKDTGRKNIDTILLTHHHFDHVDGVPALMAQFNCPLYGSKIDEDLDRLPHKLTKALSEGDTITVGNHTADIMFLPGHTSGHIAYYFKEDNMIFCGDVMFSGGCGRVFDGTMEQMFHSLQTMKKLPPETLVFCGHEYTLNNLMFTQQVNPHLEGLTERIEEVETALLQGKPSLPTTIEKELKTNLFLRAETFEDFANPRRQKDSA